jgi:deoxyribonuclease V
MKQLHEWNLPYSEAIKLQKKLASKVQFTAIRKVPKFIAGIDCAFSPDKKQIIGCVVVLDYPSLETVETVHSIQKVLFPYIPGLLSFREAPVCLEAVQKLKRKPDIFVIDGQGIAHPRRLGLAAHLGLFLEKPTIGCAKSRLIGTYEIPPTAKGSHSKLFDGKEIIGTVLRTRDNVKPLFISVGNKCILNDAEKCILNCCTRYRLPEPTRLADIKVGEIKKNLFR